MYPDLVIEAHDIRKSYTTASRTSIEILHGISLGVGRGETVAIMGPSGSGKSTLLYCLTGLERPTSGTVNLLGNDLARMSEGALSRMRRCDLGFVFQSYNLVPTLSVLDNVRLPALLAGHTIDEGEVGAVLDDLGILEKANARPATLSGGEQQRVALARVLVQTPQLLCADEPTGALDQATGKRVLERITATARQGGRAALIVTHDPAVAAHCDRVLFLRDGLLECELLRPGVADVANTLTKLSESASSLETAGKGVA